jgi:hypothetical protein
MDCPICNKPSSVKDVRQRRRETRTRKRVCENGHSFLTYEITEERMAELLDYERAFEKMKEIMKKYEG